MVHIGKLIKSTIKQRGISPDEACAMFGLSRSALYGLYRNETPSTHHIFQLFERLGVNLFSIIGEQLEGKTTRNPDKTTSGLGEVSIVLKLNEKISNKIIKTLTEA